MYRKDSIWLYSFGGLGLIITGLLYWTYFVPEWTEHQAEFRALVAEKLGESKAQKIPRGVQQIWVKELGRVDRCVTCHQGMDWKGLETAPHPFRAHRPAELPDDTFYGKRHAALDSVPFGREASRGYAPR